MAVLEGSLVWASSIDGKLVHTVLPDPVVFGLTVVYIISTDVISQVESESLRQAGLLVGVLENGGTSVVVLPLLILDLFSQILRLVFSSFTSFIFAFWLLGAILEGVVFLDEKSLLVEHDFCGFVFG